MTQSYYLHKYPNSATRATWVARQYGIDIPREVLSIIQFLLEMPRRVAIRMRAIAVPEAVRGFRLRVSPKVNLARLERDRVEYERIRDMPFATYLDNQWAAYGLDTFADLNFSALQVARQQR